MTNCMLEGRGVKGGGRRTKDEGRTTEDRFAGRTTGRYRPLRHNVTPNNVRGSPFPAARRAAGPERALVVVDLG